MFDLEQATKKWRQQMASGGIKTPAVLDELESHLREDIERQTRAGMNTEAAFKAAAERIGQSEALKAEFAKVTGIKDVRWGKVVGIACCLAALPLPAWAVPSFLTVPELTKGERLLGSAAVVLTFLSLASWRFSYRILPVIRNRRARLATTVTCGLVGLVWLCVFAVLLFTVIVPHMFAGFGAGQGWEPRPLFDMGVATLWAMALTAMLGAVAYGLEEAARRSNAELRA
jgi:hypothetical protein